MNEYNYLIKYGIVKSAKEWDEIVKNNSPEKIDLFWKSKICLQRVIYRKFVKISKENLFLEKERLKINNEISRELSVLEHILSHFVGYKPKIKQIKL